MRGEHAKRDDGDLLSEGGRTRSSTFGQINNPRLNRQRERGMHSSQVKPSAYGESELRVGGEKVVTSRPRHARQEDCVIDLGRSSRVMPAGKKKKPLWKKALLGITLLILASVVAVGACGGWFLHQLDAQLELADKGAQSEGVSACAPHEPGQPYYVLLLGSDSREGTSIKKDQSADGVYSQRADVIMMMRVDAASRQLTMVSVPRDTRYVYPDGTVAKINDTYNSGAMATVQAVSELTGAPISYYAAVDFASFEAIIDLLGGITVDVPADIQYKDALTGEMLYLEAGEQVLDGQHAQLFARARKEYGEDVRQSNNRQMIEAMIEAVFDRPVADIPETVLGAASYMSTNMRSSDLIETGLEFALGSGKLTFYSCTGPTDGDFDSAYGGTWYCYDNPEGWAKLMAVVDAGEDPSGIDVDDTAIIHS